MKEDVAERLARAHYHLEPSLVLIRHLVAAPELEADPNEPIKLLEVNEATTADGIRPVFFGPHPQSGVIYSSLIIEITPEEYDQLLKDRLQLPEGWQLGEMIERTVVVR